MTIRINDITYAMIAHGVKVDTIEFKIDDSGNNSLLIYFEDNKQEAN